MTSSARVRKHRSSLGQGRRRVEVVVPANDAALVRNLAQILRTNPEKSAELRRLISAKAAPKSEQSAAEFFNEIRMHFPPGPPLEIIRDETSEMREINLR
jgi:hypothetical protein